MNQCAFNKYTVWPDSDKLPSDFESDYQEDLASLKDKTKDIYGELPDEVDKLFVKRTIDLLVREGQVENLSEVYQKVEIVLGDAYLKIRGIGNILFEAMIPYLNFIKVSYTNNKFKIYITKRKTWIDDLENILRTLTNIIKGNKIKEVI